MSSHSCDEPGIHQGTRQRAQVDNPKTEAWTKRDAGTGRLMQGEEDGAAFKGVAYFAGSDGSSEPNWMAACLPQLS